MAAKSSTISYGVRYDKKDDIYVCDCGEHCMNERDLDQHKAKNCKHRLIQCSFCQESFPSSSAMRDHLMLCGNKTDQCPNCRKFVRRAVFAYHYENNCADDFKETDTPIPKPRISSANRSSSKLIKSPSLQDNHINDNDKEDNSAQTSSKKSDKRRSPRTIQCEYCNQQCVPDDYKTHQENCLHNPSNPNKKMQRTTSTLDKTDSRSSINGRRTPQSVVQIPCEFCNKQIDIESWSIHTQDCREREDRRLKDRAEIINREPITEKFPCEHCEELFTLERLRTHEMVCSKNLDEIVRTPKHTHLQQTSTVTLSDRSSKTKRDPTLIATFSSLQPLSVSAYDPMHQYKDTLDRISSDMGRRITIENERFASDKYSEHRRTQEALRLRDNDTSPLAVHGHRSRTSRRSSDDFTSPLINSSRPVSPYDNLFGLTAERPLAATHSLPNRSQRGGSLDRHVEKSRPMPKRAGSPAPRSSHLDSISPDIRNDRGSLRAVKSKATSYLSNNNNIVFQSPRSEDQAHRPVIHDRRVRSAKNNRKSTLPTFVNPNPWKK